MTAFLEGAAGRDHSQSVGETKAGDHLCLPFRSEAEQQTVMATFGRDGVPGPEKVSYFTDTAPVEQVFGFLRSHGLDPDRMVATLSNETTRVLAEGYRSLQATDELGPHA